MMMSSPAGNPASAAQSLENLRDVQHLAELVLRQRQQSAEAPAESPLPAKFSHNGDSNTGVPQVSLSPATPQVVSTLPTLDSCSDSFLKMAVAQNVSDIHFRCEFAPVLRKDGVMIATQLAPLTPEQLFNFMQRYTPPALFKQLREKTDLDFSFEIAGLARFRVNWLYELDRPGVVLRIIKSTIPDFEDLGLPESMLEFTKLNKGLVLLTGPTGSGKTTTLASLLNYMNRHKKLHIITLEDPVEFVYKNQQSVFTQRQLKLDTASFPDGIKYALRQDPDVILVGEMRDRETIEAALHAAETGHLVFSTLHTNDAVQTITRIINQFQPHERESVRDQLSTILMGSVSQRLIRRANGKGRLAVHEIMMVTSTIRDYIKKNDLDAIYELMASGFSDDNVSLNRALYKAFQNKDITYEDALETSENKQEFMLMVRAMYNKNDGL